MRVLFSKNKAFQKKMRINSFLASFIFFSIMLSPAFAKKEDPLFAARNQKVTQKIKTSQPKIPRFFSIRNILAKKRSSTSSPVQTASLTTSNLSSAPISSALTKKSFPFQVAGYRTFNSSQNATAKIWRKLKASWEKDARIIKNCLKKTAKCPESAEIFRDILKKVEKEPLAKKIEIVNNLVNANIRYSTDLVLFNTQDHWSTPLASLGWAGDCEDYAIAKYYLLREAGVKDESLRLVILTDKKVQEGHAILAFQSKKNGWLLLDNRNNSIRKDVEMPHYEPFYSFNQNTNAMFALPYVGN